MRTFQSLTKLAHEVTIFVPSTSDVNNQNYALQSEVMSKLGTSLSSRFGGTTENAPAKGLWISEEMGLVADSIIPLTTYTPDFSEETQDYFISLGEYVKNTMSQEMVLIVVDGQGYLL